MYNSPKHQLLFVHIPRTAGASMQATFEIHLADGCTNYLGWDLTSSRRSVKVFEHIQLKELHSLVSPNKWQQLIKVAFVRNPWERMHSYWYFIWKRYLAYGYFSLAMDIAGRERCFFNEWLIHIGDRFRFGTTSENANQLPQSTWLCDQKGSLLADFVGCYEHLESDWLLLQEKLGVRMPLQRFHPHEVDTTDRHDYRLDYTDEGIEWVKRYFAEDIDRFGYVFDQAAPIKKAA